jgi:hypothetical protein
VWLRRRKNSQQMPTERDHSAGESSSLIKKDPGARLSSRDEGSWSYRTHETLEMFRALLSSMRSRRQSCLASQSHPQTLQGSCHLRAISRPAHLRSTVRAYRNMVSRFRLGRTDPAQARDERPSRRVVSVGDAGEWPAKRRRRFAAESMKFTTCVGSGARRSWSVVHSRNANCVSRFRAENAKSHSDRKNNETACPERGCLDC